MKNKKNFLLAVLMTILSGIYVVLVKYVDVKAIGPKNSKVGLSSLNGSFRDLVGSNMTIYKLTEVLGILVFLFVALYGFIGLYQLVKRKSLFKVDREIISVGILYVLMITIYVVFEKVIINYRPILIDNELEASFPSSHTVLAICTCVSSLLIFKKYIPEKYTNIVTFITILLLTLVFLGRMISGVHWISDIIGGIIISLTLLSYFCTILKWKE